MFGYSTSCESSNWVKSLITYLDDFLKLLKKYPFIHIIFVTSFFLLFFIVLAFLLHLFFFAVHVLIAYGSILVRLTVLRLSRLEVFSDKQNTKQETEFLIVVFLRIRIFEKVNVRILAPFDVFHKTMTISHQRLYCILIFFI